ncbi:hypothetical protein AC249_AIPGENE11367, partial [Exaiptasia diaphana]
MAKTSKRSTAKKAPKPSKSSSSMNPDRPKPSPNSNMRDKSTIMRLKMYKSGGKAI